MPEAFKSISEQSLGPYNANSDTSAIACYCCLREIMLEKEVLRQLIGMRYAPSLGVLGIRLPVPLEILSCFLYQT